MSASEPAEYLRGLERMANQIAANFAGQPADQAAQAVADHLRRFWDPSMRRDLVEAHRNGRINVSGVVCDALAELQETR